MALFKRNKSDSLDAYYTPEQGGKKPVTLLLSILGLLVLAALVIGIFFGARWLYRTIKGDEDTASVTTSSSLSPRAGITTRPSVSPSRTPTPTPTPSKSVTPTPSSKALPNTGPEGPEELR